MLGLTECANTLVGDETIRGVSGGQKKRVTIGEMLIPPKSIKFMDEISNGLDSSTAFDIIQALKHSTQILGYTLCISLLQVSFSTKKNKNISKLINILTIIMIFSHHQKFLIYLMN